MPSFDDFGAPAAPKPLSARERGMKATMQQRDFNPSDDLTSANFKELESTIEQTKDPKARELLVTEHNRLKSELGLHEEQSLTKSKFLDFSEEGAPSPSMEALKAVGGETAAVADFLWGAITMPLGVGADIGGRAAALGSGESRRIGAQTGREASGYVQEKVGNPFQRLLNLFDSGEAYEKAKTTKGMKWLSEKIDEFGTRIEGITAGKVLKEDVASLVDTLMAAGGTRGAQAVARAGKPKIEPRINLDEKPQPEARRPGSRDPGVIEAEIVQEAKPAGTPPMLPNKERGSLFDTNKDANRFSEADLKALGLTRDQLKNELDKAALPARMKFLTMTAGAGAAGIGGMALYNWMQEAGDKPADLEQYKEPEPQPTETGTMEARRQDITPWLLGPGVMMAGAIKGPGGMWHPEAMERLSSPLKDRMLPGRSVAEATNIATRNALADMGLQPTQIARLNTDQLKELGDRTQQQYSKSPEGTTDAWVDKAIRNYLNKYAGTERDPLKAVEIPSAQGMVPWEAAWDSMIEHSPAPAKELQKEYGLSGDVPPGESVFNVYPRKSQHANAAVNYLSHVGDYLRQNVNPEELQRYDLVRAVKETAENDKRVMKQMEKAAGDSTKSLPVYKSYPDGFKWVELKLPEKLNEEQAKQVRKLTSEEKKDFQTLSNRSGNAGWDADFSQGDWYGSIGHDGKIIENSYTQMPAVDTSPERTWLAGRLAEEGNTMGHCVGGYCEGVASGESKIFSLRDAKGKSHVTVEVQPERYVRRDYPTSPTIKEGPDIIQIKGKQNRAPSKEYLPYVQDFVKSGKWGEVRDLENAGLKDLRGYDTLKKNNIATKVPRAEELHNQRFITEDEFTYLASGGRQTKANPNQRGSMTIGDAAKLTALGLGAAAGAYLSPDSPWFGAAIGAGATLAAFALRRPDNILRKEVAQALESMRRDVHPAFYSSAADRARAKLGEAIISSNIAKKMQHDSAVYHTSEGPRRLWDKLGKEKQFAFIRAFEKGQSFTDPTMKAMADRYSAWMADLVQKEKGLGLDYEPREHYIYHSFEDAERLSAYLTKKYGSKWSDPSFTKDRQFDLYEEAVRAGFKPKTLNPEHIMLNRQYASNIAEMRIGILEDLRSQGLARLKDEEHLATSSEVPRRAPNGKIYFVDPRADKILHNAFDTESLWARKDAVGAVFRAGMAAKNTLVPLILNLSLFHPLHLILGMDNSAAMLRSIKKLNAGAITPQQHFRDMFRAGNPLAAIYDSVWTNPKAGWRPFELWKGKVKESDITAADREILQRTFEGGFIPEMGQEWKTKAIENFKAALDNKELMAIPKFLLTMPQWLQKPLFEHWIPQLKYASYLKDTEAALQANPKLRDSQAERMVAFRKLAKSVENRYGEMAYSTLFWNRTLKDLGVLNALSLGWSLGFFREYGGGMREAGHGVINMTKDGKIARGEMDRALFVMLYTANTALYGGLATWMLTGKPPNEWLDYFYPKTGEKKKDGSDARVNTMFYSREWLGVFKHMQNEGLMSGGSQFMLNKLAPTWGISKGLWTNLDYFGKEISDPNSPAFQRLAQKLQWAMGEVTPISVQSIKKMDQPTAKNVALSIAGFSPAPRYATESPVEGKIASTYRQYHSAVTPYARARRSDDVRELYQLKQSGEEEKFRNKLDAMRQSYGLTHADTVRLSRDAKVPPTERMFRSLTVEQQRQLLNTMNADEKQRFLPFANKKLKRNFEE